MSKFLTYNDRLIIEKGLTQNKSFGEIGKEIRKDRTTVAKEVKKYSFEKKSGYSSYPYNACKKRAVCKLKNNLQEGRMYSSVGCQMQSVQRM